MKKILGKKATVISAQYPGNIGKIKNFLRQSENFKPYTSRDKQEVSISFAIDERTKLENKAFEQDIILKRNTLVILFIFLGIETVSIFVFAYFQAVEIQKFHLDEWSFRLLIAATITQITLMVRLTVKHLFPDKK